MKWTILVAGLFCAYSAWSAPVGHISLVYGENISEFAVSDSGQRILVEFKNSDGKKGKRDFVAKDSEYIRKTLLELQKTLPIETRSCNRKEIVLRISASSAVEKRACFDIPNASANELLRFADLLATYF